MSANTGVWLEDLTWPEAKACFETGMPVVIPIGAASKAHGPHLPLKTDALTARALAQKLIERLHDEAHAGKRSEPYASELLAGTGSRQGTNDPDPL